MASICNDDWASLGGVMSGHERKSLRLSAQVVDDKTQRRALWTKFAQAWFPGGVDDPDLALVCVTVSHAHYWNVNENKLTQLFVMAKAVFSGEKPGALGESGEVVLGSGCKT